MGIPSYLFDYAKNHAAQTFSAILIYSVGGIFLTGNPALFVAGAKFLTSATNACAKGISRCREKPDNTQQALLAQDELKRLKGSDSYEFLRDLSKAFANALTGGACTFLTGKALMQFAITASFLEYITPGISTDITTRNAAAAGVNIGMAILSSITFFGLKAEMENTVRDNLRMNLSSSA